MMNMYCVDANGVIVKNAIQDGIVPDGCTVLMSDDNIAIEEPNGAYRYKCIDGKILIRQQSEIESSAEYKTWWNAQIEAQLERLDIKRIRPSAEINDDNISSQGKQLAKATLKTLNEQAAALRAQLLR